MPAIQWTAFDPATGQILEPLPGLKLGSSLPRTIGKSSGNVAVTLPVKDRLPDRWPLATRPYRSVIAAHYDDDSAVLWAGIVETRGYGSGPTITLGLVDVEAWLGRQYVGNLTVAGADRSSVAAQVGLTLAAQTFHGAVGSTATGQTMDRRYRSDEDLTCLAALTELSGPRGMPEWTIGWDIVDGILSCRPTVAPRLGRARTNLYSPVLLSGLEWSTTEDYSDGRGATTVTGTASRSGDSRITVTRNAPSDLLPAEYRWQPDTTKTTTAEVTAAVDAKLAEVAGGTRTVDLRIPVTSDWVVGRDLQLGDDIEADLSNPDLPALDATVRARMVGWVCEADPRSGQITHVTPVLYGQEGG